MMGLKRLVAVPLLAGAIGVGATACQPTVQDGLVNVAIGDVTILQDVNVNVAANVVAQICGISVPAAVAVIGAIDQDSQPVTFCRLDNTYPVKVIQN
jgi:hypothetical protein